MLVAADLAGVHEIYRVGGAQAVAALAYGTETIRPVAKIVGPGNAYVAAAKRQVFGTVGIDMIAGPSEVLVIADGDNDPDWIAADLLAQAEHDAAAQSILITDDAGFAERGGGARSSASSSCCRAQRPLPRAGAISARSSSSRRWTRRCRSPTASRPSMSSSPSTTPRRSSPRITNAGAVFVGRHTPEVIGDYVGGSNHVLPTARSARFSSGLSVLDFMKRSSILKLGPEQLRALAPAAIALAKAEGLAAHARSVAIRLNGDDHARSAAARRPGWSTSSSTNRLAAPRPTSSTNGRSRSST